MVILTSCRGYPLIAGINFIINYSINIKIIKLGFKMWLFLDMSHVDFMFLSIYIVMIVFIFFIIYIIRIKTDIIDIKDS